ncbi:MAG: relaxase domain-containing protein [Phycisphaerae bacterium]|nr:relaxase domain-containing protein [Phycisphaerae bacterium]
MLSIAPLSAGHQKYFSRLSGPDYYLSGGEPEGRWFGAGAKALGLKGIVSGRDLDDLFRGFYQGKPLVQNAGKDNRQCGWDLCFSMPKSASVAFALFPELREGIRKCQEDSVKYALSEVERTILFSRKGKGGREHVPAKMVGALYEHCCSRAGDPQPHTHALVIGVGVQDDGTRALISKPLYDHKMRIGALYRSKLAELFEQRLGFKCKTVGTWFEIEGIPKELCDLFSTRRKEIVAKLDELGLESASAAAFATLDTRKAKTLVPPRAELFQKWQEQARGFDLDINNVTSRAPENTPTQQPELNCAENKAQERDLKKESLSKRRADRPEAIRVDPDMDYPFVPIEFPKTAKRDHQTKSHSREHAKNNAKKRHEHKAAIKDAKKQKLKRHVDAIQRRCSIWDISSLYASQVIRKYSQPRTALQATVDFHATQFKRAAQKKKTAKINPSIIKRQVRHFLNSHDAETVRAIASNHGAIQVLNINNSDKEHLILKACNEIWEKAQIDVWGFSLFRRGATRLQDETGIRSHCFRAFEGMRHPSPSYRVKFAIRELVRQALFNHGFKLKRLNTKDKILVINDAHHLNFDQMNELLGAIKKNEGRVLLVGSADLREGKPSTAFGHVAYRVCRNDNLQVRKNYFCHKSIETRTQENERNELW